MNTSCSSCYVAFFVEYYFIYILQLEVIGGPQPIPPLSFTLNDSSVASVAENGLITSKASGITTVVGSVVVENTSSKV